MTQTVIRLFVKWHRTLDIAVLAVAGVLAWRWWLGNHNLAMAMALAVCVVPAARLTRPLVPEDRHTGLTFAYGVMAFLVFFLLETYEFEGKVRTFPLIVGYAGLALSLLDVLSLTDSRIGRAVTRFCGAALDESDAMTRPVRRELTVFAAMGGAVLGIYLVGFLIAGPLFVALWVWIGGRTRLATAASVGLATFAFIYLLFELILHYELFRGVLILPFIA